MREERAVASAFPFEAVAQRRRIDREQHEVALPRPVLRRRVHDLRRRREVDEPVGLVLGRPGIDARCLGVLPFVAPAHVIDRAWLHRATLAQGNGEGQGRDLRDGPVYTDCVPPTGTKPLADAVALPAAPSLVAGVTEAAWLSPEGEITLLPFPEAARRARETPPFLCHARATARRMGVLAFPAFDLLELYAFVRPARFCLPTPRGLAAALGLAPPQYGIGDEAMTLMAAAQALLAELGAAAPDGEAQAIARAMARGGWPWAAAVLAALGETPGESGTAAGQHTRRRERGALAARRASGRRRRGAAATGGLCRRGERRLPPAREGRRAAPRAGRGGHRRRQDAGLYRARESLGGEESRRGLDLHLYPQPPAPDHGRARSPLSRRRGQESPRRAAQGARELSLPSQLRGGRRGAADAALRRGGARDHGALGGGDA